MKKVKSILSNYISYYLKHNIWNINISLFFSISHIFKYNFNRSRQWIFLIHKSCILFFKIKSYSTNRTISLLSNNNFSLFNRFIYKSRFVLFTLIFCFFYKSQGKRVNKSLHFIYFCIFKLFMKFTANFTFTLSRRNCNFRFICIKTNFNTICFIC